MAWLACPSVVGIQVAPLSIVFQTPPFAAPRYTVFGLEGCTASEVTRPAFGIRPDPAGARKPGLPASGSAAGSDTIDRGPIGVQGPSMTESPAAPGWPRPARHSASLRTR